jgi:hypothetical protein
LEAKKDTDVKQVASNLGIDIIGKSDDVLLNEINAILKN